MNAFFRVFKEHKNVLLIICGRNETIGKKINSIDYLLKRCNKYKSRIKFLGILPKKKIFNLYSVAEAIVIPSRLDNYPNVMLESIQFNKPIIGFSKSSLDEVIKDKETGFLAKKKILQNYTIKLTNFCA